MIDPVAEYCALVDEQMLARISAGGTLSAEKEDEYIVRFEALWTMMDQGQQDRVEAYLLWQPSGMKEQYVDVVDSSSVPRALVK